MHIFPTTLLEIAVYIYIYDDDFPSGFSAWGGEGTTTRALFAEGGGVNYKLLSSSRSHNSYGGRDESGLSYSIISSIGL